MSHTSLRYTVIGLELFAGIMAIYGGISLLVDASGFGVKEEWLHGSPFSNYQIPAVALLIFVAGRNLLPAALLWARREIGLLLTITVGVILMASEIVETYSFGPRNFQQPLMFAVGFAVAALAALMWREDSQHGIHALPLHIPR